MIFIAISKASHLFALATNTYSYTHVHAHLTSHLTFLTFRGGGSFMTTINKIQQIYIFLASAAAIATLTCIYIYI